jgi:acyl-CoA thioester hydrolase
LTGKLQRKVPSFHTTRRVEFRDTDAAGIVHFSAFFFYMESAEHELLRRLGLSVLTPAPDGPITWPRVSVSCDYQSAVKFENVLDIDVQIGRLGEKSVAYEFNFTCEGRQVARGKTVAVCCRFEPTGPKSIPIPAEIAEKLRQFAE